MERDANQMSQSTAALCRSGCGFYGSPATDGLCSKCYKDALKRKQSNPSTSMVAGRSASPTKEAVSHQTDNFVWNENSLVSDIGAFRVAAASSSSATVESVAASSSSPLSSPESALSTASPTVPAAVAIQSPEAAKGDPNCQESTNDSMSGSSTSESVVAANANDDPDDTQPKEQQKQKKKNRCLVCRKKVGLTGTGFECRCGGLFCSVHRYSNEHNCTFDYKELGAQEIRKNNPLVVGEKIQKI